MHLSSSYFKNRKVETLIENQTSFTTARSSMHIFETQKVTEQVHLTFDNTVLATMIAGKKHMYLKGMPSFDFLPGESVVLPPQELMCIDFPIASRERPTRCLALELETAQIHKVVQYLNEYQPKVDHGDWSSLTANLHFAHDEEVTNIIQRLMFLFTEDHSSKDFFINNMLQELIIRLLQHASFKQYESPHTALQNSSQRFAYVMEYIKSHLDGDLSIENLSKKACMSTSHFYKAFKNELGLTPTQYINKVRIQAARRMIDQTNLSLKEIFMACGFNNRSYFNRQFKKFYNISPGDLQTGLV
ncbi:MULTISPECIES: AraC family transcriptional regulator [Nonlabens]|uniref:AraC family transcriptional regulator n=1 Tax=Nonlabens TaxID=363408 RepID=UPI001428A30F|nr:AraC family transcriptional regulator [Nonlabens sp. SY33080]